MKQQASVDTTDPLVVTFPNLALSLCLVLLLIPACSPPTDEQIVQHVQRGDQYVERKQFAEALIEYKNAARAAPKDVAIHWKLAQAALKLNDLQTAVAALQQAIVLDPDHYDVKDALGQIYFAAGKSEDVRRIAEDLRTRHPQRPAGYLLEGRLAARENDFPAAIKQFQQAVERDPRNDAMMVAVGNLYLLNRDPVQALAWYDRALEANPKSIEAYVARGNYYFGAGKPSDGERDFGKAGDLAKGSEDLRLAVAVQHLTHGRFQYAEQELGALADTMKSRKARVVLAELKLELGKVPEANTLVDAILKGGQADAQTNYLKGRIAFAEQRRTEARAALEEAIKGDAAMGAAHLYLGLLDLVEGRRSPGEEHLAQAVKLDPQDAKAHLVLAELYLKENSFARAEQEALEVLRRHPSHIRAAILYGDSFLLRDDWGRAEAVYMGLLKQLPDNPIGAIKMALLKQRQGFPGEAADHLSEAVRRSPNDAGLMADYLVALVAAEKAQQAERLLKDYLAKGSKDPLRWEVASRFHLATKHWSKAEESLKRVVELSPHETGPLYRLAQFYLGQKKNDAAETALRQVIKMDDKHQAAHTSLGVLLATRGKIDEANEEYRRALELEPANYVAANNLAANLADRGQALDEALRYGKLALEAAPSSPFVQDTVGWIYFKKGSLEEAHRLLGSAANQLTDDPLVRYHYAMTLAQRGEKERAKLELEAALAISKTFPGAQEAATTLASLGK